MSLIETSKLIYTNLCSNNISKNVYISDHSIVVTAALFGSISGGEYQQNWHQKTSYGFHLKESQANLKQEHQPSLETAEYPDLTNGLSDAEVESTLNGLSLEDLNALNKLLDDAGNGPFDLEGA